MINPEATMLTALAQLLLQKGDASAQQRWSLADRCRSAGAIDAARELLKAEGLSPQALALQSSLAGLRRPPSGAAGQAQPEPIRLIDDWLPEAAVKELQGLTQVRLSELASSEIYNQAYGGVNTSTRRSLIIADTQVFAKFFLPRLREALSADASELVGVADCNTRHIELQVTQHGNGAFFKAHSDAGRDRNRGRKVSYVYYFAFLQRDFRGGELRVYDGDPTSGAWSSSSFTKILPLTQQACHVFKPGCSRSHTRGKFNFGPTGRKIHHQRLDSLIRPPLNRSG